MNDAAQQNHGTEDGDDGSMSRRSVLWTTAAACGRCRARTGRSRQRHRIRRYPLGSESAAGAQAQTASPQRQGATMVGVPFEGRSTVRVGLVGLGNRGGSMIDLYLAVPGVQVVAVCDPVKEKAQRAAAKVTAAGQPAARRLHQR